MIVCDPKTHNPTRPNNRRLYLVSEIIDAIPRRGDVVDADGSVSVVLLLVDCASLARIASHGVDDNIWSSTSIPYSTDDKIVS